MYPYCYERAARVCVLLPGSPWADSEWIKNLLLFFDGIALLVPEYKLHEPEAFDPVVATPLASEGLLQVLPADKIVDREATERLGEALAAVIRAKGLDRLPRMGAFHTLSKSRLGWYGAPEIAEGILKDLRKRKLARASEDGSSIPMHPMVRVLILTLLSQILRSNATKLGIDLSPATDQPELVESLTDVLGVAAAEPSAGGVVSFDLETVGADLSNIPLNEVLDFRRKHLSEHKQYARSVRQFVRDVSVLPAAEREKAFRDRQAELRDRAAALKAHSRKAWKRPATFALGAAGAAWT
jgi:hypothetical protein